jgi:GT2 family glycosyltransferase
MFLPLMIAFGCAITDVPTFEGCAEPGIRLAAEPDSKVWAHQSTGSLFRNYNLLLDMAREHEDLEALVLVHQDAEIVDPEFASKLREALRDEQVAIVGCAGAVGVRSIAWWEGAVTWASFTHRYPEWGGGDFDSLCWNQDRIPTFAQTGEVDSLDGFVMALSPWAVRELRFDESLGTLHGYDFDICMQARAAGRKVATADLRVVHHHSLNLVSDIDTWIEVHMRLADKWEEFLSEAESGAGEWKQRARRAEAEAAVQKAQTVSTQMHYEALGREYERISKSASWRLTTPLRFLKRVFGRGGNGSV